VAGLFAPILRPVGGLGAAALRTTFVGRKSELATLRRLRRSTRLLTLTGAGGSGKTRLAGELVRGSRTSVVAWVDLAPLRDPAAVAPAIERALGAAGDGTLSAGAIAATLPIRGDRVVVVLDNCEHLVEAAAACASKLLAASDAISIVATSRSPLRIDNELVWRIPSLSLPSATEESRVGVALRSDAVRLFVERARVAQAGFILDESTCADVVWICRAVDGLPLAIELAAGRTRHMSVSALRRLLGVPLRSLRREPGDDPRHRTLHATMEWSHALLDASERRVFRRVAVFVGGFALEGAAAVCTEAESEFGEVTEAVTRLVDHSLLEFSTSLDRYRMLEPVREHAAERLRESGEQNIATESAARYLTRLATVDLAPERNVPNADGRMRQEFSNAAAVLPWLIANDAAGALRLLARFAGAQWTAIPVHLSTVSDWLAKALAAWPARDALRARCLIHRARLEREVSDDAMRVANARRAADEALAIALELHDPKLEAVARQNSAGVAVGEGDIPRAIELYDEVVPVLGPRELAMALSVRCVLKAIVGDGLGAQADIDAAFAAWGRHGDATSGEPFLTRLTAADVAYRSRVPARAAAYLRDAVVLLRDGGHGQSPAPFEFLAHLAAAEGDHERALRLASFADRLRSETGLWPSAFLALTDRTWLAETQRVLASRVVSIRRAGRQMSEPEAISYALDGRVGGELTSRQFDVASLVAKGLSDKEIAGRLLISERTAENHVQHIREKLGVRSRVQIGSWVESHGSGPAYE